MVYFNFLITGTLLHIPLNSSSLTINIVPFVCVYMAFPPSPKLLLSVQVGDVLFEKSEQMEAKRVDLVPL